MGAVRIYLAVSVVFWHMTGGIRFPFVEGGVAVLLFYMISGFYMAMILNGKYQHASDFYASRFLRLYPIYFIATVGTVALLWPTIEFAKAMLSDISIWQKSLIAISNVTVLGQDFLPYFGVGKFGGNLLTLSWTLATEWEFYLVAPFLVRRNIWLIVGIAIAALLIRFSLLSQTDYGTWRYYFPPSVWCFFLFGVVSYRLWLPAPDRALKIVGIASMIGLPILGYFCGLGERRDYDNPGFWLFFLCFAAAIPPMFSLTRSSKIDFSVGELAYPVYLVHLLVMRVANQYFSMTPTRHIVAVLGVSAALLVLTIPIELFRKHLIARVPFGGGHVVSQDQRLADNGG